MLGSVQRLVRPGDQGFLGHAVFRSRRDTRRQCDLQRTLVRIDVQRPRAAAGTVRLLAAHAVYRRGLEARVGALAGQLGATELASLKRDLASIEQEFLRRAGVSTDAT